MTHLLQERIERAQAQIVELQDTLEQLSDVAAMIIELPKKLNHCVMVPLGKRAMMPGKIVRSNEILAHLGGDYFAWQSASSAVETIERKKKIIASQIKDAKCSVTELSESQSQVHWTTHGATSVTTPSPPPSTTAVATRSAPSGTCRYPGCSTPQAVKRNGSMHSLCEVHRAKANAHQRKLAAKRRAAKERECKRRAALQRRRERKT